MGAVCTSSCSVWASVDDVCSPCDDYSFPAGLLDDMLAVASDILFELSGRRFPGSCSDIVRPCGQSCYDDPVWDRSVASDSIGSHHHVEIGGGHIRNIGCGCRNTCGSDSSLSVRSLADSGFGVDYMDRYDTDWCWGAIWPKPA